MACEDSLAFQCVFIPDLGGQRITVTMGAVETCCSVHVGPPNGKAEGVRLHSFLQVEPTLGCADFSLMLTLSFH